METQYDKIFKKIQDEICKNGSKTPSTHNAQKGTNVSNKGGNIRFRRYLFLHNEKSIHCKERLTEAYATALNQILDTISTTITDPATGMQLLVEFYETDERLYGECEDPDEVFLGIYVLKAKDLFVSYASSCQDKEKVFTAVLRVCQSDAYRVRSSLFNNVSLFLDEGQIKTLIQEVQVLAKKEVDAKKQYSYIYMINCFSRQIGDLELFTKTLAMMKNQFEIQFVGFE